jgi:uncharacterized surface protein with fasciclin (FAS1) repeats
MKRSFLMIALAGAMVTGSVTANAQTASTNKTTTKTTTKTTGMQKQQGVMVGGALMVPSKNIVANALGSSEHTTLVAAVKAAGLAETLMGAGPFTVFAPTNAAFDKLPAGTVETLLKPENKAKLASVLTFHVVPGKLQAKDLKNGQKLTTVQGETLTVTRKGNTVMINGANVTTADVISSNGVTHVIDTVVLPTM